MMRDPAKHKAVIALNALLFGMQVIIDGRTYEWREAETGEHHLFHRLETSEGPQHSHVPITLRAFVEMCQKMTTEEAFLNNANVVLNTLNRKERHLASEKLPEMEPDLDGIIVL
jgi:hypothetical protein